MSYLINQAREFFITVNGVDYSDYLIDFQVSDDTCEMNGLVKTTGAAVFSTYGPSPVIEDYGRDNFKRGHVVILDVRIPGGSIVRHPRGYLYVVATIYNPEQNTLAVELACRLGLAALTDEVDALLPLAPIQLEIAGESLANVSGSFAADGKYLFQNNTGALVSNIYFNGDGYGTAAPGEWVSVLGGTSLANSPLASDSGVPDEIEISYSIPSGALNSDQRGKIDVVETTSYYFVSYPAIIFTRKNSSGTTINPGGTSPQPDTKDSGCGDYDTPPDPGGGGEVVSCSELYETTQQVTYVPATRTETSTTYYSGPGGQVDYTVSETYGPAIEANSQYFADKYSFCRYTFGGSCIPNGGCPMDGLDNILLQRTETRNYFGTGNQLVRTVTDQFVPTISGAQTTDWRAGTTNGTTGTFTTLSTSSTYRVQRQESRYSTQGENTNVEEQDTYDSITSRGSGINSGGSIDALAGIKTSTRRVSTTITTLPLNPDIVNSPTTQTEEKKKTITLYSTRYTATPGEAGPLVKKVQVPVPILSDNVGTITGIVNRFSDYIERFTKGVAFGTVIVEALREDIITNWRPGMPFRYYDPYNNKLSAMRMDACTWSVKPEGMVVGMNGIWVGDTNGTVTLPNNLVGNSLPDMGSGGTPPPGPGGPPTVDGETNNNNGKFVFVVDVNFNLYVEKDFWGEQGVHPQFPSLANRTFNINQTLTVWVGGIIVAPGDLLALNGDGGIPAEYNGSLLVVGAAIVDPDVFT
jgi:hypothetical protein